MDRAQSMRVGGRLLPAASHLWDPCNRPHMPRTQVSSSKPSPTGKPHDPVGPVTLLLFLPSRRSECTCSRLHSEKWLIPEPLTHIWPPPVPGEHCFQGKDSVNTPCYKDIFFLLVFVTKNRDIKVTQLGAERNNPSRSGIFGQATKYWAYKI